MEDSRQGRTVESLGGLYMFSVAEKRQIADTVEKLLLSLNHPEMPKEKPLFQLHVTGREEWSWAEIEPNWVFDEGHKTPTANPFNEISRDLHNKP